MESKAALKIFSRKPEKRIDSRNWPKAGSWCSVETVGTIPSDAKIEVSEAKVHQCLLANSGLFAVKTWRIIP